MKPIIYTSLSAALLLIPAAIIAQKADTPPAVPDKGSDTAKPNDTSTSADPQLVKIPEGYRDWRLISVAREEGKLDDIRAILGNDIAVEAYRKGTLPFPDGAAIARISWSLVPSEENNKAFGQEQSFVAGASKNGVQFMFKDATKYASSSGWGFAQFGEADGKPASAEMLATCHACHLAIPHNDFVFTRYSLRDLAGQE